MRNLFAPLRAERRTAIGKVREFTSPGPSPLPRDVQNGTTALRRGGGAERGESVEQLPRDLRPGMGRSNRPTNQAKANRPVPVQRSAPDSRSRLRAALRAMSIPQRAAGSPAA